MTEIPMHYDWQKRELVCDKCGLPMNPCSVKGCSRMHCKGKTCPNIHYGWDNKVIKRKGDD